MSELSKLWERQLNTQGINFQLFFTKKGRLALKRASTQNKISKLQVKENKAAKAKSEAHKKLDKLNRDFDVYR